MCRKCYFLVTTKISLYGGQSTTKKPYSILNMPGVHRGHGPSTKRHGRTCCFYFMLCYDPVQETVRDLWQTDLFVRRSAAFGTFARPLARSCSALSCGIYEPSSSRAYGT